MSKLCIVLFHGQGGCHTKDHFIENWVNFKGLHPKMAQIPISYEPVQTISDERIEIQLDGEVLGGAIHALALHELNHELSVILEII